MGLHPLNFNVIPIERYQGPQHKKTLVVFGYVRSAQNECNAVIPIVDISDLIPIYYGNKKPMECMICLERFKLTQAIQRLPCLHIFHIDCIDKWLQSPTGNGTCPICRTPIYNMCNNRISESEHEPIPTGPSLSEIEIEVSG